MLSKTQRYYFTIFVALAYFELLRFSFFPKNIKLLLQFGAAAAIILLLLFKLIYFKKEEQEPKKFASAIALMLVGYGLSSIIAYFYHKQSFIFSFWLNRNIYYYFFYFFLHAFTIEKVKIERVIIGFGILTIFLFYIQYLLYPKQIFDTRMWLNRGTLRLFLPGMGCTLIAYFYFLNKFFTEKKALYVIICLLAYSIFILQATRQLIGSIALLTVINILRSKQIKSKAFFLIIILLGIGSLFLIFQNLFVEMFQVTQSQTSGTKTESVRIKAIKFFLFEFPPTKLAYILGNGDGHQASPYGIKLLYYRMHYGFFLSDIGIIGDFFRYGAFFLVGALIMLFRLLSIKIPGNFEYLRYYIYLQIFTLFTSKGYFGQADLNLMFIAYLFDIGNSQYIKNRNSNDKN